MTPEARQKRQYFFYSCNKFDMLKKSSILNKSNNLSKLNKNKNVININCVK